MTVVVAIIIVHEGRTNLSVNEKMKVECETLSIDWDIDKK